MQNLLHSRKGIEKKASFCAAIVTCALALTLQPMVSVASSETTPCEKVPVIIIGDRVVDIAYNLGVVPVAMSVRASLWPMSERLKTSTQMLGCPTCITVTNKNAVPDACRRFGIHRLIVEKNDGYCLYMPQVKPQNIVPIMAGEDVSIEYVDFSNGLEQAIRHTAKILNREPMADKLIDKYAKDLDEAREKLPGTRCGKKAVIFSGTYQESTGKCLVRVEASGGYSDRFLLEPLGYVNVGDYFQAGQSRPIKGHYMVRKTGGGFDLSPLVQADPDVIVINGDAFAVQKVMRDYSRKHPELRNVKAVKNMEIYSLPFYVDSGVLEYPGILEKWINALAD